MKEIEQFWDGHRKNEKFKFNYDGEGYTCKFVSGYNPTYSNGGFTCSVISSFPKSKLPYRQTQYFCNNTFGDELCKMSKAELKINMDTIKSTATITLNCDKTPEMCAKYGNRKNYGGFLEIPKEFRIMT